MGAKDPAYYSPATPSTAFSANSKDCEAGLVAPHREAKPDRRSVASTLWHFWTWMLQYLGRHRDVPPGDDNQDPWDIKTRQRKTTYPCMQINCSSFVVEPSPPGYSQLAAFLSSERSFSIYRGFDYLHSRVILNLQAEIVALERELDDKDELDQANGRTAILQNRTKDIKSSQGEERPRERILDEIRQKLVQYGRRN